MAYEIDRPHATETVGPIKGWVAIARSWMHARRREKTKKHEIERLLAGDEWWLEDIGVLRSDLVQELGYDPRELPNVADFAGYRVPHVATESGMMRNHSRRHR